MIFALAAALVFTGCAKDDQLSIDTPIDEKTNLYGVVTDSNGNRLQSIVVSDGFTCATTDANGVYQITRNELAYHVFLSIPANYEVPQHEGLPFFWQKLGDGQRYDFVLTPLAGGVEKDFRLFCIADPQCQNTTHVDRFVNETVPDIKAQVAASTVPCYGITLGDIGYNTGNTDVINAMFPRMKLAMSSANTGLPIFQVIGNHDNAVISVKKADYTVAHDIQAQRFFEYKFGPVNYSFDRGDAHIIAMDNVVFPNHDEYSAGFRDDQVEWLRQDLSYVPKNKLIIFCVHIPLRNSSAQNVQAALDLLADYPEVHVMSGHTHYAENSIYKNCYEHVHGAASGAWWHSSINCDGTPNGYAIYDIKGATIANWKYKATNKDEDFQVRLYRADEVFQGDYMFAYTAPSQIVANIWNADNTYWTIDVYENGTKTGQMLPFAASTKRDAWATSYHCAVVGRDPANYDKKNITHLYYYTLQNPQASVEVRATDKFGKVYKQSTFTTASPADYPSIN